MELVLGQRRLIRVQGSMWRRVLAMRLSERLDRIETMLVTLVERATIKEHYEIEEFARLVGREPFTCREWARLGRINAAKKSSGRGPHARWTVSHEELLRYQRSGLLPVLKRQPTAIREE